MLKLGAFTPICRSLIGFGSICELNKVIVQSPLVKGSDCMITLSRDYSQKLRIIRKAERLTQQKFAEITGLAVGTIKRYETHQQTARAEVMEKVLQAPEFRKYTMWLMHDEIAPSAGQIAPALTHCGTDGGEAQKQTRKTGEDLDVRSSHSGRSTG